RGGHRPAIEPRKPIPGCRRCFERGRQHVSDAPSQGPNGPAWSKNLACAEAPWTGTGRSQVWPAAVRCSSPRREGEEPEPMLNGRGKSASAIVAGKPTNKAGQPAAESVEPSAEAEGNASQQSTRRAQDRESVSQALERIRQVARQRKKERFTSLFHHIS